jgi:oligopeptide transport system substrate-binding protein
MKKILVIVNILIITLLPIFSNGSKLESDKPLFVIANQNLEVLKNTPKSEILVCMFDGQGVINQENGDFIPGIVDTYENNQDFTIYRFHLKHLEWSDGTIINADTFISSWMDDLNPVSSNASSWFPGTFLQGAKEYHLGKISSDEVGLSKIDDFTIEMDLIGPIPNLIEVLQHYNFMLKKYKTVKDSPTIFRFQNFYPNTYLSGPNLANNYQNMYMTIFEGLVSIDAKTADIIPGLAESWEIDESGTKYTFYLRKTNWSDGVPITADDIVYSWLRNMNIRAYNYETFCKYIKGALNYSYMSAGGVGIRALDNYTFQLELIKPAPQILSLLATNVFAILPKHAIQKYGKDWIDIDNFVCNGPFVFNEANLDGSYSLLPNKFYWDKDNIKIDKIIMTTNSRKNLCNQFIDDEIDWVDTTPYKSNIEKALGNSYQSASFGELYVCNLQLNKNPLNNPLVRKSIQYAINRGKLVNEIDENNYIPSWGIIPPSNKYSPLLFPFNNEKEATIKAQDFLKQAGYPNGKNFPKLTFLCVDNYYSENILSNPYDIEKLIVTQLTQKLNIPIEIKKVHRNDYIDAINTGNYDITFDYISGTFLDSYSYLEYYENNYTPNYSNEDYDNIIKKANNFFNDERYRFEALNEAENFLINKETVVIPLFYNIHNSLIDIKKWGGWYNNKSYIHPVKNLYLK